MALCVKARDEWHLPANVIIYVLAHQTYMIALAETQKDKGD